MVYGLRIKDASGNVLLNTADLIGRIIYFDEVAADDTDSTTIAAMSGKTVYGFSIPLEAAKSAHEVSISGTTFSWTAKSDSGPPAVSSSSSLIGVIILD